MVEAGSRARVTSGPCLINEHEHRVAVAIQSNLANALDMTGRVALAPVVLAASTPVGDPTGGQRAVQGLVIHPADHQHLSGVPLLGDRGEQPVDVALEPRGHLWVEPRAWCFSVAHLLILSGHRPHPMHPTARRPRAPGLPALASVRPVRTVGAMSLASAERAALADLLEDTGPDAPTLCEGWTTRDLAAHLVVREGRPDAGLGLIIAPLAPWTERLQRNAAKDDYADLVGRVRSGPPTLSWFGLPGVDANANAFEYLVHHEDVRRAAPGWEPRSLPEKAVDGITARLRKSAKFLFRRANTGVTLLLPGGETLVARGGEPMVTLVGDPVELVLQAFGRGEHARVQILGDDQAVAEFVGGSFGV
jgi:uncharacterized protein (TIGR03085 family)